MPSGRSLGRLVKRRKGSTECLLEIRRDNKTLKAVFSNHATVPDSASVSGAKRWALDPVERVYIPVKEMLANAPGFLSLYSQREVHFEEIYADIINRAYTPPLRGPVDSGRRKLLDALQKTMDGKVTTKKEEFFLRNAQGNLEFTLLAEGMRKLGLLWILIQNRALIDGSVLFWDEAETNLNPKLYGPVIDILRLRRPVRSRSAANFGRVWKMTTLKEGDIEITVPPGVIARKFDDPPSHGLTNCMKALDFVGDLPERRLFIESKIRKTPVQPKTRRQALLQGFSKGDWTMT